MTTPESRSNAIDYVEMPSRDLRATKHFFAALFGWEFEDYGPDYIAFHDGRLNGGFFASEQSWTTAAGAPLIVFYTEDLEMIRADVVRLGGIMIRDIFAFPGGRRFHFEAPGSGEFALWSER